MTKEWVSRPFASCIDQVAYTQKVQRKDFLSEGKYPIVSQEAELINGYWDNEADVFRTSTPVVLFGDHTRSLKYVDFDFALGADGVKILKPHDFLDPKFFYFQLQSVDLPSLGYARHYRLLKEIEIKFPQLPEQQRIVALLDEAFAGLATAKANAERNLQHAREIFDNHLAATFSQWRVGWAEMSLETVVDPSCTLSYGIVQPGEYYPDGLPVVRPTDLGAKLIRLDGLKRIDPKLAEGYRRTTLQGGELLLCVRGSTGVVSIAAPELRGANVTRGIVPVRFNSALMLPELGYHLMKSEYVQSQIREKTYGAALMQINIRDLRAITLFVPPLKEQSVMALALSELDAEFQHLTHIYERKLAALEELKQSLLQQAFNGEL